MSTITTKRPHDSSFSFSRRYFHWNKNADPDPDADDDDEEENLYPTTTTTTSTSTSSHPQDKQDQVPKKNLSISKLKSALSLSLFAKTRSLCHSGPGSTRPVIGTLFGHRRGHVHFAFQSNPKSSPSFLIELATPTCVLIREMASGLVRIALECEKKKKTETTTTKNNHTVKLLEEAHWRTYCNGRKCGYANRRECREEEWKVLKAVEPISMGAGVLPAPARGNGDEACGSEGELMYMRAKFERVMGSKDSEAFYMMNPDGNGGPELSVYLLRV